MHKRSSRKKDLNESAYALVQKVTAPSSSGLSGPITTAAQAKRLLQLFPDTMCSAKPPPPREACEDKLALEVIEENGGVVNPQRPFHLQDKTLAWLERHERIVSRQVSTETVPAKN